MMIEVLTTILLVIAVILVLFTSISVVIAVFTENKGPEFVIFFQKFKKGFFSCF